MTRNFLKCWSEDLAVAPQRMGARLHQNSSNILPDRNTCPEPRGTCSSPSFLYPYISSSWLRQTSTPRFCSLLSFDPCGSRGSGLLSCFYLGRWPHHIFCIDRSRLAYLCQPPLQILDASIHPHHSLQRSARSYDAAPASVLISTVPFILGISNLDG